MYKSRVTYSLVCVCLHCNEGDFVRIHKHKFQHRQANQHVGKTTALWAKTYRSTCDTLAILQKPCNHWVSNYFTVLNWKTFGLFHIPSSSHMQQFSLLSGLCVSNRLCCRATWSDYKQTPVLLLVCTNTHSAFSSLCLSARDFNIQR